ncbi:MAG: UDP-N-acetylglucosamine--N-acetylmuramyl-(pentapeptide) pyrophosphoryl-undecaprenol N-acetylglucosamine transferase [Planctomycetota bacterium]
MSKPQLIFAGGGTGGHIYPALAIAEQARQIEPDVGVRILCSMRAIDAEVLASQGVAYTPIPASPPIARPAPALRFLGSWIPAVRAAKRAIRDHQRVGPATLVSMGGFVSAPAVAAARSMRVPVVLVNLDAVPGRANRLVARHAHRVFTACAIAGGLPEGWTEVGPIVRAAFTRAGADPGRDEIAAARSAFGLDPGARTLLVTGGSQGASSINELLMELLARHSDAFAWWQVIHQVGRHGEPEAVSASYERIGVRAWVGRLIGQAPIDMAAALLASDLSIGRCGAGSVAEAWAARTPAVFLPYPYHADHHQRANARPLARAGSAIVLDDRIDPHANLAEHGDVLAGLLRDAARLGAMQESAVRLPPVDGASRVAAWCLDNERAV